jgi:ankyrin repeat protein
MSFEYLSALAAQLSATVAQLEDLLSPFAHPTCPLPANYASAFRKTLLAASLPGVRVGQGHVVGPNICSKYQEVILYDSQTQLPYEEAGWQFVPYKAVRGLVRIIQGELIEADLVLEMRELADLASSIRRDANHPLAVAIWAPEATRWDVGTAIHLAELVANQDQLRVCSHLVLGSSVYAHWQWQEGHQSWAPISLNEIGNWKQDLIFAGGACLLASLQAHLQKVFALPAGLQEKKPIPSLATVSGGNMIIPVKGKKPNLLWDGLGVSKKTDKRHSSPTVQFGSESEAKSLQRKKERKSRPEKKLESHSYELRQVKAAPTLKDKDGNTSLHLAAHAGEGEAIGDLLRLHADINARNYVYATPLHLAVEQGHDAVVKQLLQHGAELEARNNRSQTALHTAAIHGNISAAKLLMTAGADIAARMEKGVMPIHLAAWYGQGDFLQMLVEAGANLNSQNEDGNTPLHFAAFKGQVKAIKVLINHGADPSLQNQMGDTYLLGLNEGYQGEMIRILD